MSINLHQHSENRFERLCSVHAEKPPTAQREQVRGAVPVQPDGVPVGGHAVQDDGCQDDGELRGRHDVNNVEGGGLDAADDAAVPVQDGDDGGAALVPVERGPARVADDAQPGG